MLAGDYNVIPTERDVYKPERWVNDALFRVETRAAFARLMQQGWTDAIRTLHPAAQIYTFWDYFRNAYGRDAGLRIDPLLLNGAVRERLRGAGVYREVRGWERASDHAPTWVDLMTRRTLGPARRIASLIFTNLGHRRRRGTLALSDPTSSIWARFTGEEAQGGPPGAFRAKVTTVRTTLRQGRREICGGRRHRVPGTRRPRACSRGRRDGSGGGSLSRARHGNRRQEEIALGPDALISRRRRGTVRVGVV